MITIKLRWSVFRRLAKSILVLIPLFGVPHVLFLVLVEENLTESVAVIKLYSEMAFNSFNVCVSLCYIYLFRQWWRHVMKNKQSVSVLMYINILY